MTPDPVIGLHEVAEELAWHYDTVRKNWRAWAGLAAGAARFIAFPLPCKYPAPGTRGAYGWRLAAIRDFKLARERALGEGHATPAAEPSGRPRADAYAPKNPRLKSERAHLLHLLERA